jgi:hypothetical protein
MANVVFFEGFETVGTETGLANEAKTRPRLLLRYPNSVTAGLGGADRSYLVDDKWSEGYAFTPGVGPFSGGNVIRYDFGTDYDTEAPGDASNGTTFTCGFRVHIPLAATSWTAFDHWGVQNPGIAWARNIQIEVQNSVDLLVFSYPAGVQTLQETVAGVLTPNSWHYIEVNFKIADSPNGVLEVYLDGTQVTSIGGVDTNNTQVYAHDYLRFGCVNSANYIAYDDIYLAVGQPLTPQRVYSLPPTSDSAAAWTPDSGTDNYARIDENGVDDPPTTGYVDGTTGQKDKYGCTDLAAVGDANKTLNAAKVEVECLDTGATGPTIQVGIDIGGEDGTAETVSDAANYQVFSHHVSSAGWQEADIDAARVFIAHS